jgi:hypothetical protein
MTIGDPLSFAIESEISQAYRRLSLRALGFFVIHIAGHRYGVYQPDATMLANSFDEVERRLERRGSHLAPFAREDAAKIAEAFRRAYDPDQVNAQLFGMMASEFYNFACSNGLLWAPDGDEAFDDGSYVVQFDVENQVRLLGFKSEPDGYGYEAATLTDMWIPSEVFYRVLQEWHAAFEQEWRSARKVIDEQTPIDPAMGCP